MIRPFEIHHGFCGTNEMTNRYAIRFPLEILKQLSTSNTDLESLFQTAPHSIQLTHQELAQISGLMEILPKLLRIPLVRISSRTSFFSIHPGSRPHPSRKGTGPSSCFRRTQQSGPANSPVHPWTLSGKNFSGGFVRSSICKQITAMQGISRAHRLHHWKLFNHVSAADSLFSIGKGRKVKEVGKAVGFRTYTHFIRTFTCKLGQSPKNSSKPTHKGLLHYVLPPND